MSETVQYPQPIPLEQAAGDEDIIKNEDPQEAENQAYEALMNQQYLSNVVKEPEEVDQLTTFEINPNLD